MKISEYKVPNDIEEAYSLLTSKKNSVVMAGGLFLRLQKKSFPLVIDLSSLDLDFIKEKDEDIVIGAMTTLRELETSKLLPKGISDSVKQIAGVGARNLATIGGSVCGRYPFSDIDTALIALDAKLEFYQNKEISMKEYYTDGLEEEDILLNIKIPKNKKVYTKYFKKVYTDFSIVNVSVCDNRVVVGARPERAIGIDGVDFSKSPKEILENISFSDDFKASKNYRRAVCETLLEDIIKEMEG